jgi:hypothetical protein
VFGARGSEFDDTLLERLEGLTQVQGLFISNTKVSDAGLEHVGGLTHLRELHLRRTKATDGHDPKLPR